LAQTNYLLMLEGVQGESQVSFPSSSQSALGGKAVPNSKPIDVLSFSFNVENAASIGSGTSGAGAGKVKFKDFEFTMHVNTASPALFEHCSSGHHYNTGTLYVLKAGGTQQVYMRFDFRVVFVTSIHTKSIDGDPIPVQVVTFAYGELGEKYAAQTATGTMAGTLSGGWSQVLNKKI
jgi:type VI secretion system secreted protein Hcp